MFTLKNSGIKIPLPSIEVSETDEGWDKVDVLNEKLKTEENKPKENLQLMKTLNHLKELEAAYQRSAEELALEKNKHADTLAQNNKNRETIMELLSRIESLEKNIAVLTKQKDEIMHESEENAKLRQAQESYMTELRKRLGETDSNKEKAQQNLKEFIKTNEILKKNLEESKSQLIKLALDHENEKLTLEKEQKQLHHELKTKNNDYESDKLNWSRQQKYLEQQLKTKINELDRKTELLENARAQILKMDKAKMVTIKGGGPASNTRKKDHSIDEAQTRSVIKYDKRGR